MISYSMTRKTGTRALQGAVSGVSAVSARRRGGSVFGQLPVVETVRAPWAKQTPGIVDHNWTCVTVPDGWCRSAT
jgi:hypothetical protein